jgi:hypothetical protein
MTISTVSWQRGGSSGSPSGTHNGFKLFMGVAAGTELTDTFEANCVPGTRTLVYQPPSQVMTAAPDEWMSIVLDTPYEYDGASGLIVELQWVGGVNMFYTYMWPTGSNRGLMNKTDVTSPRGTLYTSMSEIRFDSPQSLESATFGSIKASF